jgi:uncharacterized protein YhaN
LGPWLFQAASPLETALESRGPIPMIADDVLIPFDDHRTANALQALAGLRAHTRWSYSHITIMSAS